MAKELSTIIFELQTKFKYGFLAIIFGSLALSIQYSPKMGNCLPYLLLISWVCLLISGLIGGWTVNQMPLVYYWMEKENEAKSLIRGYILASMSKPAMQLIDDSTGENMDENDWKDRQFSNQKISKEKKDELNKKLKTSTWYQKFFFVAGIIGNLAFAALNYLKISNSSSVCWLCY